MVVGKGLGAKKGGIGVQALTSAGVLADVQREVIARELQSRLYPDMPITLLSE